MPSCTISGCETNLLNGKMRKFLKFYRFPSSDKEHERREVWIRATNKKLIDGSSWLPDNSSVVCEKHFVNKCKSDSSDSPSFNPTLFLNEETTLHQVLKKRRTEGDDGPPAKTASMQRKYIAMFTRLCMETDPARDSSASDAPDDGLDLPSAHLPYIAFQSISNTQHPQPVGRWGHSMTMVGAEEVLVVGGQGNVGDVTKDYLWRLDLAEGKWCNVTRMSTGEKPGPRLGHTCVYDPVLRCLYMFGGMRGSRWCAGVSIFDNDSLHWSLIHDPSHSKPSPNSQPSNGETMITTSTSSSALSTTSSTTSSSTPSSTPSTTLSTTSSTTSSTTPSTTQSITSSTTPSTTTSLPHLDIPAPASPTNTDTTLINPPLLSYHSCVSYKHRLYIFGGTSQEGTSEVCSSHLYTFDCLNNSWSIPPVSGNPPPRRSGHSGSRIMNMMVVFGGWDAPVCFNDVHLLNMDTMTWFQPSIMGPAPSPRSWHTSCLLSSRRILIHGGFNGNATLNDMFILNIETQQWTAIFLQPPLSIRAGHTSVCLPYCTEYQDRDKVLMLGGGDNADLFYNDLVNVMVPIS